MQKKSNKTTRKKTTKAEQTPLFTKQNLFVISIVLISLAILILLAMVSYFTSWQSDQSILTEFTDKQVTAKNWLGKIGAQVSHLLIYKGFGVASLLIPVLTFTLGLYIFLRVNLKKFITPFTTILLSIIWLSLLLGLLTPKTIYSGTIGQEVYLYTSKYIGKAGVIALLLISLFIELATHYRWESTHFTKLFKRKPKSESQTEDIKETEPILGQDVYTHRDNMDSNHIETDDDIDFEVNTINEPLYQPPPQKDQQFEHPLQKTSTPKLTSNSTKNKIITTPPTSINNQNIDHKEDDELDIEINNNVNEKQFNENKSDQLLEDFGEFDPTLELSKYRFPTLHMLKNYNESIAVNPEELKQNKNRIVETLKNYNIGISHIKATVGPTITLYEIIPQAGVRISKIKNLEDDIALSLSALGIRIIAPIPGKGTIGIEVPNKKPTIVSMHSVIASEKFQNAEMELPLALGKTITNETFVVDLAKMPHLLMAGATGQGKSVGLNAITTSLLYKKHPAEVKFVLVDPKKVELTLYNKIERHFLAKLPDSEEAIITDTKKVVNTLNSLCIEMDSRYELMKDAMVRNIKEYNKKFKERRLNPEQGHRFLPYIVLIIDEFADLIMTAGKEVETPIARLAQLARAIGIHLIVATQRPSVNVITGIIKANFPARIAFRVTSKIDSRTILDSQGADQLIGKGDMLFAGRNELVRLQCAFVDTPEVEKITDYIGSQRAYPEAHLLPEFSSDDDNGVIDLDLDDRDQLFEEAALVIVRAQQGSASLLQRKLKLGYNRAGRIIDQLEAAGIVGSFEGSKARQVLVPDEIALRHLLDNELNNKQ